MLLYQLWILQSPGENSLQLEVWAVEERFKRLFQQSGELQKLPGSAAEVLAVDLNFNRVQCSGLFPDWRYHLGHRDNLVSQIPYFTEPALVFPPLQGQEKLRTGFCKSCSTGKVIPPSEEFRRLTAEGASSTCPVNGAGQCSLMGQFCCPVKSCSFAF